MSEFHWTVPVDHPAFAGHFPGRPIVPGVVLLDRLLLCLAEIPGGACGSDLKIGTAKFSSPALPGDVLHFSVEEKSPGVLQFRIDSAGRDIASGTLSAAAVA